MKSKDESKSMPTNNLDEQQMPKSSEPIRNERQLPVDKKIEVSDGLTEKYDCQSSLKTNSTLDYNTKLNVKYDYSSRNVDMSRVKPLMEIEPKIADMMVQSKFSHIEDPPDIFPASPFGSNDCEILTQNPIVIPVLIPLERDHNKKPEDNQSYKNPNSDFPGSPDDEDNLIIDLVYPNSNVVKTSTVLQNKPPIINTNLVRANSSDLSKQACFFVDDVINSKGILS